MNSITKIMIAFALCSVSFESILTGDKSVGQTSVNVVSNKQRILPKKLVNGELISVDESDEMEINEQVPAQNSRVQSQSLSNEDLRSASYVHGNQEVVQELEKQKRNEERTNSFITPNSELKKRIIEDQDRQERYPSIVRPESKKGLVDNNTQSTKSKVTSDSNNNPTPTPNNTFLTMISMALVAIVA